MKWQQERGTAASIQCRFLSLKGTGRRQALLLVQQRAKSRRETQTHTHTPDGSLLVVGVLTVGGGVGVGGASGGVALLADGILVHGGVGLGGGVVGRRHAVTGLTAVVTVSVVHSAGWVLILTCVQEGRGRGRHDTLP